VIRLLEGKHLIRILESPDKVGRIWIPDVARKQDYEGVVYQSSPVRRTPKCGAVVPSQVKRGDHVVIHGWWSGREFPLGVNDTRKFVVIDESEIVCVIERRDK
jgi:co-chaperonin GroES (HSP10)